MKNVTYQKRLTLFCVLMMLSVVIYAFIKSDNEFTKIAADDILYSSTGWSVDGEIVELPLSVNAKENVPIVLTGILPENIPDGYGLEIKSLYSKCQIFVDDEEIYCYGAKQVLPFGNMTGNIRMITKLDSTMAGREVKIVITPYYSLHMDISAVRYASIGSLEEKVLTENLFRLAIVVSLLTIMVIGEGLALYQLKDNNHDNYLLFANFSAFAFVIVLWIICSSDIPQFFTNANEAISLISFLCLTVIAIPYLGFCALIVKKGREICETVAMVGWILPIINIIGFVTNLFDPPQALILSHIYIGIAATLSVALTIANYKEGFEAKILFFAVSLFALGVAIGMTLFYIAPSEGYASTMVGISMLVFVTALFGLVLYRQMTYIRERKYLDTYRELAFKDILTGVGNRSAFEKKFESIRVKHQKGTLVTLYIFDMNHLKHVNDEHGHPAGDALIAGMAECLEKTFRGIGSVYRLGGDEFAAVVTDLKDMPENVIDKFRIVVEEYNEDHKVKLSAACGWYEKILDDSSTFIQDIYRFADLAMYADKQRMRAKQ